VGSGDSEGHSGHCHNHCLFLVVINLLSLINSRLKVVLDEIALGQGKVNFRINTYSLGYIEILGLISKCDTNTIHHAKMDALHKQWAQLGRQGLFHLNLFVVSL
jgi:hypothetical protein